MAQVTATRLSFKIRYALLTSALSLVMMAVMSLTYTNYVDKKREDSERKNDQQWCELITFYDDYYTEHPPNNELQKLQAALMHKRRISLGCPNK